PPPAPAARARGGGVSRRASPCHSVAVGEDALSGPNLRCVLGRHAGTLPGFKFSPAMTEAGAARGLVWTRETLGAFLVDPQRLVPGAAMWIPGLTAPEDRGDLIDYLEQTGPCSAGAPPSAQP